MSWRHRGFTWKPRSSLTKEKTPIKLASGFCIPEPLPMHTGIKGDRCVHWLDFCFGAEWMRRVLISTKPFIFVLFLVGVTVRSAESLSSAIPLGTSTKRANSKRANHGRSCLFQDAVSVRVLLVVVIFSLRMMDTIVVFSVWASNMLKMRSWMTHAPVVGVWAWFCSDLAFPFWKDWHPLTPHAVNIPSGFRVISLVRPTGRPAFHSVCHPWIGYRSQHRGWVHVLWGWRCGGAAPLGCCRLRRTGPRADGHACPGSREYWAGGQQTAQSWALAAGWLVSRSGARLTAKRIAFFPGGAWGAGEVVDGPFHGQKLLVRLLRPHYPRWRGCQGVRGHSPGGESGRGAPVPTKRRHLEEPSVSPVQGL